MPREQLNTCDIEISASRTRTKRYNQTTLRVPVGYESMAVAVNDETEEYDTRQCFGQVLGSCVSL